MSWDPLFLGKEQNQLTRGGGDPAMRCGVACSPRAPLPHRARAQRSPARAWSRHLRGILHAYRPVLGNSPDSNSHHKPSPSDQATSSPGQPSSQGKRCAGRQQRPEPPQSSRPRHLLLCVLTFPGLGSQGNPRGKVLHQRDAQPVL